MAGGDPSWLRSLRALFKQGREYCRECGVVSPLLTPGHMIPRSLGGKYDLRNLTPLCLSCQRAQGANVWFWQVSLWEEGYRARRGGGLWLPDGTSVHPPPRPPRQRTARVARTAGAHIPPVPGCICSSCTMWRSEKLFDLDGHSAADRRGQLS